MRFAALRVDRDSAIPARARVESSTARLTSRWPSRVTLYDENEDFIASLTGGLFRAVVLDRRKQASVFFSQNLIRLKRDADDLRAIATATLDGLGGEENPESWLILEAFARSLAYRALQVVFGDDLIQPGCDRNDTALPLVLNLLDHLHAAGLSSQTPDGWRLAAGKRTADTD